MATCSKCNHHFRVPPDEAGDHACPKCGWHPSQEPQHTGCIHRTAGGLCGPCSIEAFADPEAWEEYGDHPAGIENWKRLQAEMDRYAEECSAIPRIPEDSDDLPF